MLLGHPRVKSYSSAMAESYIRGAKLAGADVKYVKLAQLKFDPVGAYDHSDAKMEPDLKKMQQLISWAEHIVFVYPTWWGGPPGLLKGFMDRIFTPGFAYKYRSNSIFWDRFLKGRSARIITTYGGSKWGNRLFTGAGGIKMLKWSTCWFCGISPVYVSDVGNVRGPKAQAVREQWLEHLERVGFSDA